MAITIDGLVYIVTNELELRHLLAWLAEQRKQAS